MPPQSMMYNTLPSHHEQYGPMPPLQFQLGPQNMHPPPQGIPGGPPQNMSMPPTSMNPHHQVQMNAPYHGTQDATNPMAGAQAGPSLGLPPQNPSALGGLPPNHLNHGPHGGPPQNAPQMQNYSPMNHTPRMEMPPQQQPPNFPPG